MNRTPNLPLMETTNAILEILLRHCGEWVTDAALLEELGARRSSFYQKAVLDQLALTRRIHMRAVSTPSEFHYEYKYR